MTQEKIPAGTKVSVRHFQQDRSPITVDYVLGRTTAKLSGFTTLLRYGSNKTILESKMLTQAISEDGLQRESVGVPIVVNRPHNRNDPGYDSLSKIVGDQ
tara:strand:- start:878 stop:1177 length:300 start_codon:yes stop_codon:yes gene_type:complete